MTKSRAKPCNWFLEGRKRRVTGDATLSLVKAIVGESEIWHSKDDCRVFSGNILSAEVRFNLGMQPYNNPVRMMEDKMCIQVDYAFSNSEC